MRTKCSVLVSSVMFAGVLAGGLGLQTLPALPEYTQKERKECDFCHPSGDLFALNEAGKYYAEHHSLEGVEGPVDKPPEAPKPKPEPAKPKPPEPGKSK